MPDAPLSPPFWRYHHHICCYQLVIPIFAPLVAAAPSPPRYTTGYSRSFRPRSFDYSRQCGRGFTEPSVGVIIVM